MATAKEKFELAQQRYAATFERHLDNGVNFISRDVYIEPEVVIAPGATILPGCILRGNTTIAAGSVIGPGSGLTDAVIGKNCIVKNTYITESTLEENGSIGPFSQVRPGCHIAAGCKIGDFVEVKNSHIGQKTAIAHLTYVGDTDCGSTKKLQVNMANIRKKLGSVPGRNTYILNELGVGYRMIDEDTDARPES